MPHSCYFCHRSLFFCISFISCMNPQWMWDLTFYTDLSHLVYGRLRIQRHAYLGTVNNTNEEFISVPLWYVSYRKNITDYIHTQYIFTRSQHWCAFFILNGHNNLSSFIGNGNECFRAKYRASPCHQGYSL